VTNFPMIKVIATFFVSKRVSKKCQKKCSDVVYFCVGKNVQILRECSHQVAAMSNATPARAIHPASVPARVRVCSSETHSRMYSAGIF
jgi:hypothetical protein